MEIFGFVGNKIKNRSIRLQCKRGPEKKKKKREGNITKREKQRKSDKQKEKRSKNG